MRTYRAEQGFTLVELLVASVVTMMVVGAAFSAFKDALTANEAVSSLADSSQNLRAGSNLMIRDLLQIGRNLQIGGIAIPSGTGSRPIARPSPPGASYSFNNTTATTLSIITTGNSMGGTVDGRATDMITVLMDDPNQDQGIRNTNWTEQGGLVLQKPGSASTKPQMASDGASFTVGPETAWLVGNPANGLPPIKPGDLIYFSGAGTAIQTVTRVQSPTIYFDPIDPFSFNQRSAVAGTVMPLLAGPITVKRVYMYTYFVAADADGLPRLMRMTNFSPAQALAGVIEDLQFSYDLVDGATKLVGIATLPLSQNGNVYSANQVQKINVQVRVRSEAKSPQTKDYLRTNLTTMVALRNLAYIDEYK